MNQKQTKRWYKRWYLWLIMYVTLTWWIGLVFLIIDLKKDHEALKKRLENTYQKTSEYKKERLKEIESAIYKLTYEAEKLQSELPEKEKKE